MKYLDKLRPIADSIKTALDRKITLPINDSVKGYTNLLYNPKTGLYVSGYSDTYKEVWFEGNSTNNGTGMTFTQYIGNNFEAKTNKDLIDAGLVRIIIRNTKYGGETIECWGNIVVKEYKALPPSTTVLGYYLGILPISNLTDFQSLYDIQIQQAMAGMFIPPSYAPDVSSVESAVEGTYTYIPIRMNTNTVNPRIVKLLKITPSAALSYTDSSWTVNIYTNGYAECFMKAKISLTTLCRADANTAYATCGYLPPAYPITFSTVPSFFAYISGVNNPSANSNPTLSIGGVGTTTAPSKMRIGNSYLAARTIGYMTIDMRAYGPITPLTYIY